VPAPDRGSFAAVQAGAVPAVSALEITDPAFAAGSPLDQLAEAAGVFDGAAGGGDLGPARYGDGADPEFVQVPVGCGVAVAAVGGDRARNLAGAPRDPADRGRELGGVRRVASFDGVIDDDAVVVVGDLSLLPEFDGPVDASLADRPGVGVVQAD